MQLINYGIFKSKAKAIDTKSKEKGLDARSGRTPDRGVWINTLREEVKSATKQTSLYRSILG